MDAQGMDDLSPEQLANVLSILTGDELTPDELLSNAWVLLVLAPDDPRRERLYLAVLRGQEAQKTGIAKPSSGTSYGLRLSC